MNKIACIYHSRDLDGWMSAAIVKHWFTSVVEEPRFDAESLEPGLPPMIYGEHDALYFIGYDYGQPIPDLSGYNKVIMCDISLPKLQMDALKERLGASFIWIDHHISAILENGNNVTSKGVVNLSRFSGNLNTKFSACELTWEYFFSIPMPEIVRLLGRYDCFGHKGTPEETRVLEFQYGARQIISNYEEAYTQLRWCQTYFPQSGEPSAEYMIWEKGAAIYKYLCTEAKQIYKRTFPIKLSVFHEHITDDNYSFLCVNQDRFNPINFGIDYHEEGYDGFACFWLVNGRWSFSLYNDNGLVDCSQIAKQYGGGGHKGASGFTVDVHQLNDFLPFN